MSVLPRCPKCGKNDDVIVKKRGGKWALCAGVVLTVAAVGMCMVLKSEQSAEKIEKFITILEDIDWDEMKKRGLAIGATATAGGVVLKAANYAGEKFDEHFPKYYCRICGLEFDESSKIYKSADEQASKS